MPSQSHVDVVTFGCRLNAQESDAMQRLAMAAGLSNAIVVNTCAVTAEAERQGRQAIRRLRRQRPDAAIVVTGCAAQIDPTRYGAMPEATHVVANTDKLAPDTWRALAGKLPGRLSTKDSPGPSRSLVAPPRTRAYLDVQNGCDHRCTFCIIPYGRGPSRSLAIADTVARARAIVAAGAREIVLTGVDLTAWGGDLPGTPRLGTLVAALLEQVPELPRLRLSSLDPAEIDEPLFELFAGEARLMPHAHLSLQAGDDLILKRMKRRHSAAQALHVIERLRARRGVAIGADLIAGFPTEDDTMFAQSLALVAQLDFVHVFPYSPRAGTPAARMPQLDGTLVRQRAAALRNAAKAAEQSFLARQIGTRAQVLVERSGWSGHAESFARVMLNEAAAPGRLVEVAIEAVTAESLTGRVLQARAA